MPIDLLAHAVNGDGPPLLLLNGGLMTYAAWEPLAVPIARSCRVVRCDFRGQLLSLGEAPPTLAGHADDVLRLMDALGIETAHMAGASFGALVAITLAARTPSRVRSLIAISATERVTPQMWADSAELRDACHAAANGGDGGRVLDLIAPATFSAEYRAAEAASLAARRQVVSMLPRAWFAGLEQLLASLENLDLTQLLPLIRCPALVIGGEADATFPTQHSRALAAGIRGARLVVIQEGSHGLTVEHAPTVVDLVVNFVREAARQSGEPVAPGHAGSGQ